MKLDYYEIELGFKSSVFVLLEDEQKLGVGLFTSMIYYIILYPYLLSFDLFNSVIFRIFTCFICFCR